MEPRHHIGSLLTCLVDGERVPLRAVHNQHFPARPAKVTRENRRVEDFDRESGFGIRGQREIPNLASRIYAYWQRVWSRRAAPTACARQS